MAGPLGVGVAEYSSMMGAMKINLEEIDSGLERTRLTTSRRKSDIAGGDGADAAPGDALSGVLSSIAMQCAKLL